MAEPAPPPPVKLICGMLSADPALFDEALASLAPEFGPADVLSDLMDFDLTDYYEPQMGDRLYRRFAGFERPVLPGVLARAKHVTNAIEAEFARRRPEGPPRPINLDPGLIEPAKLVLASMKNFAHRIYLADGVWAEVTLLYRRGRWEPLAWTFPDYASGRYDAFLSRARNSLRAAETEPAR